jgi:hypothetical protein
MVNAGFDVAIPRRRDKRGWRTLEATLRAGITFHSCGCSGPGYRPRTWSEVRERRTAASRLGLSEFDALQQHDPWTAPPSEQ